MYINYANNDGYILFISFLFRNLIIFNNVIFRKYPLKNNALSYICVTEKQEGVNERVISFSANSNPFSRPITQIFQSDLVLTTF
jgi:hypothetical protein